jgi:hypothetical protein
MTQDLHALVTLEQRQLIHQGHGRFIVDREVQRSAATYRLANSRHRRRCAVVCDTPECAPPEHAAR